MKNPLFQDSDLEDRIVRSGSWKLYASYSRVSFSDEISTYARSRSLGFRLFRTKEKSM